MLREEDKSQQQWNQERACTATKTVRALGHDQSVKRIVLERSTRQVPEIRFEDLHQQASNHFELVFSYRPYWISC